MTYQNKIAVFLTLAVSGMMLGTLAANAASVPTLSLNTASGDAVQLATHGDPNSTVLLNYFLPGATQPLILDLGTTDADGYFSTVVASGAENIPAGVTSFVTIDGAQSTLENWPSYWASGATVSPMALGQTSVTLNLGQVIEVGIFGNAGAPYFVSSNSNTGVISANISGGSLALDGVAPGNATIVVCSSNNTTACASVSASVLASTVNVRAAQPYIRLVVIRPTEKTKRQPVHAEARVRVSRWHK